MKFETFDQVMDFAIDREVDARLFYLRIAQVAEEPVLRDFLESLADQELDHQKKLAKIKQRQFKMLDGDTPIPDLGIADVAPDVSAYPNMSLSEALVLAMNKEKYAYRMYFELSRKADNPELKVLFSALADEEANHKVGLEIKFDDHLLNSDQSGPEG